MKLAFMELKYAITAQNAQIEGDWVWISSFWFIGLERVNGLVHAPSMQECRKFDMEGSPTHMS